MNEDVTKDSLYAIMTIGGIYILVSSVVGFFAINIITGPISKIMKGAEKIAAGDAFDVRYITSKKEEAEVGDLVKAFNLMTSELQENLNEASRQKKQIETILLHMTDGVIAFDMDGKILHINPAARKLLRLANEDDTFDKIFKKLNIDINIEKIIYLENWTSTEEKVNIEDTYLSMFFAPFKDENDRPAGVMVLIQDITEHVKLDNMRKEFVADVSHELKTPITSIMGYADTLLEGEYEKDIQDRFLGVISSEAKRMARLVSDLLTLSKYDNKQNKCEKTEFDLGELVKQTQENLSLEIQKKKHNVECYVTADVPMVYADKYGIERVVINILTNSIKYTPEGGNIKIYVGFVYKDAYIKIIDNGIGIPEKDLSRIFERFYRVDKARTRAMGGTGLGLSIAKEILDQNGGSIDIKSIPEKGTEVVIRVPTKNAEARQKNEEQKNEE
jgi:two-component system sensor histidine kinase VicK